MSSPKFRIRLIDTIAKISKSFTVNKEVTISVDSLMEGLFEFVFLLNLVGSIIFLYSRGWFKFVEIILDLERTVYGLDAKLFVIRFL